MIVSISTGLVLCAAAGVLAIVLQVIYNLFVSPLRNIPGPLLARMSSIWLTCVDFSGYRTTILHRLHQKYGSSIRIAPNELSFSNIESVKTIYGQNSAFLKAPIYETMSLPPLGIFSMRGRSEHSHRRRLLSHAFAQSSLFDSEPLLRAHVEELVAHVERGLSKPLDMMMLFRLVAFDIVGELFLGQSFGGLSSSTPPPFLLDMDQHFILCGIENTFPLVYKVLRQIPLAALQHFLTARDRLIQYGKARFEHYIDANGRQSGRKDLLTKIVSLKSDTGEAPLTDLEIYTEVSNLILAGTDTTSMTLTYMFWQLAKNPEWQSKLREELRTALPGSSSGTAPAFTDVTQLPLLDAVIKEALRLHPAAPASLPRETPRGGTTLDGHHVPEGTIVSMQCYTTQRDPTVFANPDTFDPSRWLESETESEAVKELVIPFSKGPRACLGKNLAMMELKLITAPLVKGFEVSLAPTCTDDSMVMNDHFLVLPKGGKCELIFERVK